MKRLKTTTNTVYALNGLIVGLFQYIYQVSLYDHFGGNAKAMQWITSLITLSSFLMLILQIPSGAISDYFGRKKSLIASFSCDVIGLALRTAIFFIASRSISYWMAIISVLFMALSVTLWCGPFIAWLVDSVREQKTGEGHGLILSRAMQWFLAAKITGAMIGLTLYLNGHSAIAFTIGTLFSLTGLLYCVFCIRETASLSFHQGKISWKKTFFSTTTLIQTALKVCWEKPAVGLLMLVQAGNWVLLYMVIAFWPIAMKINFGTEKMSAGWYAVLFSSFGAAYLGTKLLEKINRNKIPEAEFWLWFIAVSSMSGLAMLTLGLMSMITTITVFGFVTCLTIFNIGCGFLVTGFDILVNYYIPPENSQERSTILACSSMLNQGLVVLLMLLTSSGFTKNIERGWMIPSAFVLLIVFTAALLMRRHQRKIAMEAMVATEG